ncbi:hypothetical protein K2X33_11935 [bacterium]|nr:hypothetical protein [bacterium]
MFLFSALLAGFAPRTAFAQVDLESPPQLDAECVETLLVEGAPQPARFKRMLNYIRNASPKQIVLQTAGLCTVATVGVYACKAFLSDSHALATVSGLGLVYFIVEGLKLMLGPQWDYAQQEKIRLSYAGQHLYVQSATGRRARVGILGDRRAPDIANDVRGRLNERQQMSMDRIGSIETYMNWLGRWVPDDVKAGEFDRAADLLVSNILSMSYLREEVLVLSQKDHNQPVLRELCLAPAYAVLFMPLIRHFENQPEDLQKFEEAVQFAIDRMAEAFPTVFGHYSLGMRIFFDEWMSESLRMHKQEFKVLFPPPGK